jgi:hypothetical protein
LIVLAISSSRISNVVGIFFRAVTVASARPKFPPPITATRTGKGGGDLSIFIEDILSADFDDDVCCMICSLLSNNDESSLALFLVFIDDMDDMDDKSEDEGTSASPSWSEVINADRIKKDADRLIAFVCVADTILQIAIIVSYEHLLVK